MKAWLVNVVPDAIVLTLVWLAIAGNSWAVAAVLTFCWAIRIPPILFCIFWQKFRNHMLSKMKGFTRRDFRVYSAVKHLAIFAGLVVTGCYITAAFYLIAEVYDQWLLLLASKLRQREEMQQRLVESVLKFMQERKHTKGQP